MPDLKPTAVETLKWLLAGGEFGCPACGRNLSFRITDLPAVIAEFERLEAENQECWKRLDSDELCWGRNAELEAERDRLRAENRELRQSLDAITTS